jgi:biopolymer transport protein ExbB/TolQ
MLPNIEGACLRAARVTRQRLARGQAGLSMIATTAPLFGVFRYIVGIFDSFRTCGSTSILGGVAGSLSEAGAPMALSLLVAVIAHVQYRACEAQLEAFDTEMHAATLSLANELR